MMGTESQIIFFILIIFNVKYISIRVKNGYSKSIILTSISTAVYVIALWIPSHLQEQNIIESKLVRLGFLNNPSRQELNLLAWHWSLELIIITSTEWVFWKVASKRNVTQADSKNLGSIQLTSTLLIAGLLFYVILPPPPLEARGLPGQGIPVLLRTFLLTGTALSVYYRFHKSRLVFFLTAISMVVFLSGNVRSPILVIGLAYIARELPHLKKIKMKTLVFSVILLVLFSFLATTMSSLRANITRNQGFSPNKIIERNLSDPVLGIYGAGLDTLDGYRFSREIATRESGRPQDLLNIALTFIPRQIWEKKPSDFSVDMSAKYLGYQVSGQFLSPIGYLTLIFDSYLFGLFVFVLLILIYSLVSKRYFETFWNAILLTVAFRFFIGGSSFDIYYGLTLVVPILVFNFLSRLTLRKGS